MTSRQKFALGCVAAVPLIFGGHQISEGFVWHDLDDEVAVKCYVYIAYSMWPLYVSVAFALVEWTRTKPPILQNEERRHWSYWPYLTNKDYIRRWILSMNVLLGAFLLVVTSITITRDDDNTEVEVANGRLQYQGFGFESGKAGITATITYVYIVIASIVVSSLQYSTVLGVAIGVSFLLTQLLWTDQVPSTWCFFAAVLSCLILLMVWCELESYRRFRDVPEDLVQTPSLQDDEKVNPKKDATSKSKNPDSA
jgi:hypothetical protein